MSDNKTHIVNSDDDEVDQSPSTPSTSLASKRASILQQVINYEFYGIYDADFIDQLSSHFEISETFFS